MTYQNLNDNNRKQFDEQRMLQALDADGPEQEKLNLLTQALRKITEITIDALSQSVAAIKTPTALVTETQFIQEFLKQCDRSVFNSIKEHIVALKMMSELQPLDMTCQACKKEYKQGLTLDMSNFFAPAS